MKIRSLFKKVSLAVTGAIILSPFDLLGFRTKPQYFRESADSAKNRIFMISDGMNT